jgi:glycosyltransferase involved in cell wall biosynthesis
MKRFARLVQQQAIEILHAHGRTSFSFLLLLKSLGLIRVPVLLHDHYGKVETDTSVPLWFRLLGRHGLDYYVGVCDKLGAWALAAGVPQSKVAVISNSLNLGRIFEATPCDLRAAFSIAENTLVGLVVAGVRPEKGIELLLEAVSRCVSCRPFKIIIAGGDRDPQYGRFCRQRRDSLGLKETVIFAGERADVPNLIRGADFALMPSLSESGPLVLLEYMAGGLPFVSARVGDIASRLAALQVPEFVPPNDTAAFARGLSGLLTLSPESWQDRIRGAQQAAADHFDVSGSMKQWRSVYRRLLRSTQE